MGDVVHVDVLRRKLEVLVVVFVAGGAGGECFHRWLFQFLSCRRWPLVVGCWRFVFPS